MEIFANDKIDHVQKFATTIFGDSSFKVGAPVIIKKVDTASEVVAGKLTKASEEVLHDWMHSKFYARQVSALPKKNTQVVIKFDKELYTWAPNDRQDTEQDGITVLAAIMPCVKPH